MVSRSVTRILFYPPSTNSLDEQADYGGFSSISTSDGTIHQLRKSTAKGAGLVVFLHGNGEAGVDYRERLGHQSFLLKHHLLLCEFPGYSGSSRVATSQRSLVATALEAIEMSMEAVGAKRELSCVLWGRSLGGAVAAQVALSCKNILRGLVIESSFSSLAHAAKEAYPLVPTLILKTLLFQFPLNTEKAVATVDAPLLVAHSPDDEMIGFHHAERIWRVAPHKFVKLEGDHNDDSSST